MNYLFEESDALNTPIECFFFEAIRERFPVTPHWHYFMEIIYMMDGDAELYDGAEKYILSPGDLILLHPKRIHSIYAEEPEKLRYAVMKFDINCLNRSPNYAPKLRSIFRSAERRGMNVLFPREQAQRMDAEYLFLSCIAEMQKQEYGCDLVVQTKLYELLLKMIRYWQERGFSVDNSVFAEDLQYDIYNITEYIDEHMREGIRVTDVAKQCGMSYSYFAKKFLAVYGKTCKEYMESLRLYKAEEFLIFTDFDLNYISQETGFSDCSHLIKTFRQYRGMTPKQFRKQRGKRGEH